MIDIDPATLQQLLATLFAETKDQGDAMGIYDVMKNRVDHRNWGNTLLDVIRKPYQFTGYGSKEYNKVINNKLTPAENNILNNLAMSILTSDNSQDFTGGATHYFNPRLVRPSWASKLQYKGTTGIHDYYQE